MFRLKVTLTGIKPPVWRRILVHASTPLDRLHEYIQAAFGWWNHHLDEFEIDRVRYGIPDPDWDVGAASAARRPATGLRRAESLAPCRCCAGRIGACRGAASGAAAVADVAS